MKAIALLTLVALAAVVPAQDSLAKRTQKFLAKAAERMYIPGLTYAVVKDGKVVAQGAYGMANLTYQTRTTLKTKFLLASVTKQFTAAAVMKLIEEGLVELDAPISKYLEDSPSSWSGITVRNLLGHTGGLKDRFEEADRSKWRVIYSEEAMFKSAVATPTDFAPGEQWQYTDQGYFLLGRIVETVTRKSYRTYLTETFFKPLGMNDSTTIQLTEVNPNLAQGYSILNQKWLNNSRRTDYGLVSHFGVVSTSADMAKWTIALQAGKVVKSETMKQMWTPVKLADGRFAPVGVGSYGFGWFLERFNGESIVQHGGSTGTSVFMLPERHLSVIVLTNLEQLSGGDATTLARAVARLYCPATSLASLRDGTPADAAVVRSLTDEVKAVLRGEITPELYEPNFAKLIAPSLKAQATALKALGDPSATTLVREEPVFETTVFTFRMKLKAATLYATFRLNTAGKITHLMIEEDLMP